MAKKNYHHLKKRGKTWYFRKGETCMSLETTVATEAMRLRDKMLENYILTGRYTTTEDENSSPTFGQAAKEWAAIHSEKVKYTTWRDYQSSMNGYVLPAFKDKPIDTITYLDVENFVSALGVSGKRANNILVPMRSVFKMAKIQGYVSENVMLMVENRSTEKPDIFPLSFDEVVQFLDAVDPYYRPYATVRFFTGLRAGEADGLEWSDYKDNMPSGPKLHINKSFVYGQEGRTKTKSSKRFVDCNKLVVKALEEQRKLTGDKKHIFLTRKGERMNPDHFRHVAWTKGLKKAGLAYRPSIQTRHTFATMMITAGEDLGWVKSMMGHSSLQMIMTRYFEWIPNKTRSDGSAFEASIANRIPVEKEQGDGGDSAKVIPLFSKNGTNPVQSEGPKRKGSQTDL